VNRYGAGQRRTGRKLMQIAGNVFLVSGAASGLGAATVRMLAARGATVVALDLRAEAVQALAAELRAGPAAAGGGVAQVHPLACDVTSAADCAAAVERAAALGPLRGLVSCAGILAGERTVGRDGPHDLELFARVVGVNLVGTFNLLRLAAAAMARLAPAADEERGVLVNTASIAAYEGQVGQAAYAASKGGVAAMTLPIARDLARSGIRCVALAPGLFETPMLAGLGAEACAALGAQAPFPARLGRPAEFARLVEAVITNPMLNGEVIRIDAALRMPPR
jgi:NAD(P)-dependent dehydrogenase (short-subunit alcohol dehydrogenase family)